MLVLPIIFLSFVEWKSVKQSVLTDDGNSIYVTSQGRMDGKYVSYYKNGKKKAEGLFENNYRTGKWTLWDSTGNILVQRDYSSPFNFTSLFPQITQNEAKDSFNQSKYILEYNEEGFIENFMIKERDVAWSKRIWRLVKPEENPVLFENSKLFSFLNMHIHFGNITAYAGNDDEFRNKLIASEIDISSAKVIGFKIKEDAFFDNKRSVSETRIIGISPVVINKQSGDTSDLYWIYFPEIRKYLAKEKIEQKGIPAKIKTYDDLFFYRYFHGQILTEKSSSCCSKATTELKTDAEKEEESKRIEIDMIETEHDLWIRLLKKTE